MPKPTQKGHEPNDPLARPVIMVGSGRSGSTLFVRALNAHPELQFFAETQFVVARLWADIWDNHSWLCSQQKLLRNFEPGDGASIEIPADVLDAAHQRAAVGVRRLFGELLEVDRTKAAWGFKEVWNGNSAVARVPWNLYQAVFPGARWVHLVRDPFTFARSSAGWNGVPLTMRLLHEELRHWVQVVTWSRLLRDDRAYQEIRYEDLSADPEACLTPILAAVGLDWHERCAQACSRRTKASRASFTPQRQVGRAQLEPVIEQTPGLASLMQEFGYAPPDAFALENPLPGRGGAKALGRRLRKALKRSWRSRLPSTAAAEPQHALLAGRSRR